LHNAARAVNTSIVILIQDGIPMENGSDMDSEFVDSLLLEELTGTKASTWRYWAMLGKGPASFKLGRRRVWRKTDVLAWIAEQQAATGTGRAQ
jgi:prophage regulatory protein